jgi:hypothetical protein
MLIKQMPHKTVWDERYYRLCLSLPICPSGRNEMDPPLCGSTAMRHNECTIRSCPSSVRVNTRGLPSDHHKSKKAWTRGSSGHLRGPLSPGDALTAGRVGAHRLCRPPPRAASHHSCVLTLPPAAARGAHETTTLRATSRHGPSVPPPWPASRAATVWRSPSHWSAEAVATARGGWHGASRNYNITGCKF